MNLKTRINKSLNIPFLGGLFGAFLIFISFLSCSDDINIGHEKDPDNNDIIIQFAIPDLRSVLTRSTNESGIDRIDAFLFNESGYFISQENYTISTDRIDEQKVLLRVGGNYADQDITIYLVANGDDALSNVNSIDGLRKYMLSASLSESENLPMIGMVKVNTSATETSMTLTRSVAKVSANCEVANIELQGIQLYGTSTSGYLASPMNIDDDNYSGYVFNSSSKSSVTPTDNDFNQGLVPVYAYPSYGFNYANQREGAFAIVKVKRESESNPEYYRINLRKESKPSDTEKDGYIDATKGLTYLNLLPNHHYKIEITGFFTSGYSSAEEAARHPESDQFVVYAIHDHAMEVLSMVTDGYNEFGLTPDVTLSSSTDVKTVVVKCYSPDRTAENPVEDSEITFEAPAWLSVSYKGRHIYKEEDFEGPEDPDNPFKGDYDKTWDPDNPGQQFEYEIQIAPNARDYEDLTGIVRFKWNGLERIVTVNFEAAFLLPEVCSVTLEIYEDGTTPYSTIKDYWTFVTAQGTSHDKNGTGLNKDQAALTPLLLGIKPTDMIGSKKRMNGFHFPMPYGKNWDTNPWTYVYTVNFENLLNQDDIIGKTIQSITAEFEGDSFFANTDKTANNVKWNYTSGNKGTLTLDSDNSDYTYAGGKINFTISYTDKTTSTVSASLYHTGFFHYEGNEAYAPEEERGYYYYEVIEMADGHWLDRNIGATSNVSYIDIEDPNHNDGKEASGRHYTIINELQDFNLPVWDFEMIPPGYHVPNQTEWDELRLDDNFVTQSETINGTLYMTTFYKTGNSKIGNIYFQKARFRNSKNLYQSVIKYNTEANSGDAGAGYYWSVTEAPAMEKEQMGNWLRALYLNGSSSTYNNASVTDHRMPIRCKSGTYDQRKIVSEHYISFNVHEATHVYFYHKENLTPLFNFPGKAIGSTSSAKKWQHFYCSTTQDPKDLLMIFVKLDEDGKVLLRGKSGDSFRTTQEFDKLDLKNEGWEVITGKYYDFCEVGQDRDHCVMTLTEEPKDCKTTGDDNNNNQGGSQDPSTEYKPGGYETERGDSHDPEGRIIWEGNVSIGWFETKIDYDDWDIEKPGNKLRIYGIPSGSSSYWQVHIRRQGWGQFLDEDQSFFAYEYVNGYVEIELRTGLLNDIRNNKLMICGENFILKYVTLIGDQLEREEPEPPTLNSGPFLWEGNETITWSKRWEELKSDAYDWSQVPENSELIIEYIENSNAQVIIEYTNGGQLAAFTPWINGGKPNFEHPSKIPLTRERLDDIIAKNGIVIAGGGDYILLSVEIKFPL